MRMHKPEGKCENLYKITKYDCTCYVYDWAINYVSAINCKSLDFVLLQLNKMFTTTAGFNGHSSTVYRKQLRTTEDVSKM